MGVVPAYESPNRHPIDLSIIEVIPIPIQQYDTNYLTDNDDETE